jgi:LPXTG-motif cell wall-anchored protein
VPLTLIAYEGRRSWSGVIWAAIIALVLAVTPLVTDSTATAAETSQTLSGTVTASDSGDPLAGIEVKVYRWVAEGWRELAGSDITGPDGAYLIEDLGVGGINQIEFVPPTQDYVTTTIDFPFEAGENILDQVLERSATISGNVLAEAPDGSLTVIPGTDVWLTNEGGTFFWVGAVVDENGDYTISGIPSGTYLVEFNHFRNVETHLASYWDGALDADTAQRVTLSSGETRSDINGTLILGSTITGRITGSDGATQTGASATAFRQTADGAWVSVQGLQGSTDANGDFTILGLRPGTYKIGFLNRFEGSGCYAPEYFDNQPSLEAAGTVTVGLHENIGGVGAVLELAEPGSCPGPAATPADTASAPAAELAATGGTESLAVPAAALMILGLVLVAARRRRTSRADA